MREMSMQLSLLNQTVGGCIGMAFLDLQTLDVISRRGPLTPSELASMSGLSPATMTGILDRLENEGWVRRERDPHDRRKVNLHANPRRGSEIFGRYRGMQDRLRQICADYTDDQLALLIDFIGQVIDAGTGATAQLRES